MAAPIERRPPAGGAAPSQAHGETFRNAVVADPKEGIIARYEALPPKELVLFLVGMRINRWSRPDHWMPVLAAMRRMLRQLQEEPEAGLLALTATGYSNPLVLIQYWQSEKHLFEFAHSPRFPHWLAMRTGEARRDWGISVGIWHESYRVEGSSIRSLYANMPRFGLAQAFGIAIR